jgi:predicted Rdx family selenoprotein
MDIVITYCEECNFTPWATSLRDALQQRYGTTATLRDAGNGFFFVDVDGRRIFINTGAQHIFHSNLCGIIECIFPFISKIIF